jgi:hypothetical protein
MYAARVNEDPAVKRLWIAQIVSPAISGPLVEALGANFCFL